MSDNAMPPANADAVTKWKFLEENIDDIMANGLGEPSNSKYMSIYTVSYNYIMVPDINTPVGAGRRTSTAGVDLMGSNLHDKLTHYFAQHSKSLCDASGALQDETLLQYYVQEWDRYTTSATYIDRLFAYLNRHWVKRERDEGRKGVCPVYTLALMQWKTSFFLHVQSKQQNLSSAILRLIERQRKSEQIDEGLVKKVVDSTVSLGLDEADLKKVSYEVYDKHLKQPFLEATEKYYRQESTTLLAENSVPEYLKKVEEYLRKEEDRVERYLTTTTREELITKCEHVLIREHSERLLESFQELLDHDMDEDLQRMYTLLVRIPEGLEPMLREKFEEHVKKAGQSAVAKLVDESADANADVDPKAYVDALLEVHHKNAETVARSFKGDAGFLASLDRVCRELAKNRILEEEYIERVTNTTAST